jgi:Ca-activated chloride channel family protein
MSLLVPAAFAFGLIIPIILLFYFMRPQRQERVIGSTLLWQQALQELQASRPWQRLRITWLLLIQLLAAAIIVLVLLRPAIFSNSQISGNTIIILQASASMQATDTAPNRFEAAKQSIADFINDLGPNDRLSLITMARTPRVLIAGSQDKTQLQAALQQARVTNQDADLEQALSLAISLAQGVSSTQVVVIGDGHVTHPERRLQVPFSVRYLSVGKDTPNMAILALSSRIIQGNLIAFAQIANFSNQQRAIPVQLYADGRLVDVKTITLGNNASGSLQWGPLTPNTRTLHARLVIQDALAVDHDAWAIVGGSMRGRVLLVTPGNRFLEVALRQQPNVTLFKTSPQQYSSTGTYDLTVFDSYIPPRLPNGNLFFVNPPPGTYPFGRAEQERAVNHITTGTDPFHILENVDLSNIHTLRSSHTLKPAAWAHAVIQTPQTPLLVAGENDNRRIAALGFDLHNTDLPLQPAFPILMRNITSWFLPAPVPGDGQVEAGSAVSIQVWPGANQVTITNPEQRVVTVGPPFPVAPFAATDQAGLYKVTQHVRGQEMQGAFTVNLFNPVQSRLAPAKEIPVLNSTDFNANTTGVSRQLREIWPWIAAILLLILCIEWWLFGRSYGIQRTIGGEQQLWNGRARTRRSASLLNTLQFQLQERYRLARKQVLKATRRTRNTLTRRTAKEEKHVNI